MQKLYLMRHGQTVYNTQHILQGRCDSPLTDEGIAQARRAAAGLSEHGRDMEAVDLAASSPLGRAEATLDIVRAEVPQLAGAERASVPGLAERDYGTFEAGPVERLGVSPWDPGDAAVRRGGETNACARYRIVSTLRSLMNSCEGNVLAVSHGSISLAFKTYWAPYARCAQDVPLGNCCILVFEYDRARRAFANTEIVNPA